MSFTEFTYVLVALGVLAFNLTAVYVAWRALFRNRAAGRRRCPRCWHDMSYTDGMTCTECGLVARKESHFARTRRRWGVALVAISACVAMALTLYWQLMDRDVTRYIPTAMLLPALPVAGGGDAPIPAEVTRRATRDQLTEEQWHRLVLRAARGDWTARPPDQDWVDKYARIVSFRSWRIATDDELAWPEDELEALMALPPQVTLTTRTTWPAGTTPSVEVKLRDWWPRRGLRRVRITPQVEGAPSTTLLRTRQGRFRDAIFLAVPGVEADREVDFEVEVLVPVETEEGLANDEWESMSTRTVGVDFAFDDTGAATPTGVDDATLSDLIGQVFAEGAVRWRGGFQPVRFRFNPQLTYVESLDDTAIGVHVDLLRDDTIVRRLDIWWLGGVSADGRGFGSEQTQVDLEALRDPTMGDDTWALRITGDLDLALRAGDAGSYWSGSVTIPVTVREQTGRSARKPWERTE